MPLLAKGRTMRGTVVVLATAGMLALPGGCEQGRSDVRVPTAAAIPPESRNCFLGVQEAAAKIGGGALLLDVRGKDEYDESHLAGAVLIPLGDLEAGIADNDPFARISHGSAPRKDQTIIVYCASGIRSLRAVRLLRKMGYPDAWAVEGGIAEWSRAGLPLAGPAR